MKFASILLVWVFTPMVFAQDKAPNLHIPTSPTTSQIACTVTCNKGEDARTIEVAKTDGGCEVNYIKKTGSSSIASAKKGVNHCKKIQSRVKANLVDAGYRCKTQTLK